MWRAARFTSSYADPLTDDESEEENFEDGLDFEGENGDEDIAGIRRRLSDEAAVARVGEALNRTLEADRDKEAAPNNHFTPIQVRFPVNAPALRPPIGAEEINMPDIVDFDAENGVDGEKAQDHARHVKIEFDQNDVRFWFSQLEAEMEMGDIRSQWLKKTVLQRNLPTKQREDVKAYLILPKTQAGNNIYLNIKTRLIKIYAPKPADSYNKALTRAMVGLPSQLGLQIVDDICEKPDKLVGCCCAKAALAIWSQKLPVNIRAHISQKEFNKDTYKDVFEAADQVYLASRQVEVAAMSLNETLPAFSSQNQPQPAEVAAIGKPPKKNKKNKNKNQNNSGGSGSKPRGPRHSSNPPDSCCDRHYRHGPDAWYCLSPTTCPWASRVTAKSS